MDNKSFLLNFRRTKKVKIGDREVTCKGLTVGDLELMDRKHKPKEGENVNELEWMTDLIMLGVLDENGERMFSDDERELVKQLDTEVFGKLADTVFELSPFNEKAVEEAEKNSEEARSGK